MNTNTLAPLVNGHYQQACEANPGDRVVVYSGPHYGRVHQVLGHSETLVEVLHWSGDRFSVPYCDLEVVERKAA